MFDVKMAVFKMKLLGFWSKEGARCMHALRLSDVIPCASRLIVVSRHFSQPATMRLWLQTTKAMRRMQRAWSIWQPTIMRTKRTQNPRRARNLVDEFSLLLACVSFVQFWPGAIVRTPGWRDKSCAGSPTLGRTLMFCEQGHMFTHLALHNSWLQRVCSRTPSTGLAGWGRGCWVADRTISSTRRTGHSPRWRS